MGSIADKVAIMTGAGSGIGRASAKLMADKGAKVVVVDMNEKGGRETVRQIQEAKGEGFFVAADLSENRQVQEVVGQTLSRYGAIHVLHNNAGILRTHASFEESSEEDWRRVLDVNLTSIFLMTRAVVPMMRAGGGGAIVNMASSAALDPLPYGLAYSASKAGVLHVTRSFADLLKDDKIRVNAICPRGVDTQMVSQVRRESTERPVSQWLLQPSDIADLVHYLATHDTLTGQGIIAENDDGRRKFSKLRPYAADVLPDFS